MSSRLALVLAVTLLLPSIAEAQSTPDATMAAIDAQLARIAESDTRHLLAEVTRRGLTRFRRSVTIGPTLSVAPGITLDSDRDAGVQIGGGLALLRYRISTVPTLDEIQSIVLSAVKAAVVAQVEAAAVRGETLSATEQQRIAVETWQRLRDELLLGLRPRHLEKPRFALIGEVAYLTGADAWDVRAMAGVGISRVLVSVGASVQHDGDLALVVPIELSLPVLLTHGLRSPVAQIFLRADLAVAGGDDEPDRAFAGVRLALDVL